MGSSLEIKTHVPGREITKDLNSNFKEETQKDFTKKKVWGFCLLDK